MPSLASQHIDAPLSNISVAYIQGQDRFIASKVFPNIPVQKQSDRYFKYNKGDWFRDEAQVRAPSTESAGGDYTIDNTPSYFCTKYAFHKDVSDDEVANADTPLSPERDATQFLTEKLLLRKEVLWQKNYFGSGIWGTDFTGVSTTTSGNNLCQWSDFTNGAPITDVRKAKQVIAGGTGFEANTFVLGRKVFDKLCDHPLILDRIKYTQRGVTNEEILASLFGVDQVLVANGVVNSAAKGATDSLDFLFGNSAMLCYVEKNPGLQKPSAGYMFSWAGLLGSSAFGSRIKNFRIEALEAQRIEGEMAFDMKVVATDLGVFFNGIVA